MQKLEIADPEVMRVKQMGSGTEVSPQNSNTALIKGL